MKKKFIMLVLFINLIFFQCYANIADMTDEELFNKGNELYHNYQADISLKYFYNLVENYPQSEYTLESIRNIVATHYFFGDYKNVIECFNRYSKLVFENKEKNIEFFGEIISTVAVAHLELEQYNNVLSFAKYIDIINSNQELIFSCAVAALQLNESLLFEQYSSLVKNHHYRGLFGFILLQKNQPEKAFEYFDYYLENLKENEIFEKEHVLNLFIMSMEYMKYNRVDIFYKYYKNLVVDIPTNEKYYDNLYFIKGAVEFKLGLYNKALESFNNIKRFRPDSEHLDACEEYIKRIQSLTGDK